MDNCRKVELLAPAGNAEGFYGAIHAGADAVYLAGDRFGARAYAENFTTEKLIECIRYAHLLGRKVYLTVNTLLKESELAGLYDYLLPFCEAGLDAVIVQDLGVLRFIRTNFPECKLHVSTQMTLCSGWGASLLREMGASRVVPARELSLRELISMKEHSDIEIETFIHGAMCYCYSGQCLFSSILGGRSGNRGRCAQPCRLPYTVSADGVRLGEGYPLSLKDMCTIEYIPQLIEAGIDSFKIEGRMKKPEYAAGVTAVYRRYIDRYYELREKWGIERAGENCRVERSDRKLLHSLYIRSQVQDGYYFRRNGAEMVTMDSPAYCGTEETVLNKIREKYIEQSLKLPIAVRASFQPGQPAEVTLSWENVQVSQKGDVVELARKQPITEDNIRKQLCRLGESPFYAVSAKIDLGEDCFYPLKQMNELRRAAVAELEQLILAKRGYGGHREGVQAAEDSQVSASLRLSMAGKLSDQCHVFSVCTLVQLQAVSEWTLNEKTVYSVRIYVDGDLLMRDWKAVSALCKNLPKYFSVYAALPYVLRESDSAYLEELYRKVRQSGIFRGFLARSMDGVGFLREMGGQMPCRTDAGVYTWNTAALRELSGMIEGFCLPYELKGAEQRALLCKIQECPEAVPAAEKIVYGRIPMMLTANCLFRTAGQCRRKNEICSAILKDRYGRDFPVSVNCMHCINIIYNSVPYSLHQELPKWRGRAALRMDFTIENAEETKRLLDSFGKNMPFPMGEYTTGHEKRGVE